MLVFYYLWASSIFGLIEKMDSWGKLTHYLLVDLFSHSSPVLLLFYIFQTLSSLWIGLRGGTDRILAGRRREKPGCFSCFFALSDVLNSACFFCWLVGWFCFCFVTPTLTRQACFLWSLFQQGSSHLVSSFCWLVLVHGHQYFTLKVNTETFFPHF